jgi:hypothetical protein
LNILTPLLLWGTSNIDAIFRKEQRGQALFLGVQGKSAVFHAVRIGLSGAFLRRFDIRQYKPLPVAGESAGANKRGDESWNRYGT